MTMLNYPAGVDCVWIASDTAGNLGAFVTAGMGPIPILALNNRWIPIADIEEAICRLPEISTGQILVSMKRPDDFIMMAERGFFVYDWQDIHRKDVERSGKYEKVAEPATPLSRDFLPSSLLEIASSIVFQKLTFSGNGLIDLAQDIDCVIWSS